MAKKYVSEESRDLGERLEAKVKRRRMDQKLVAKVRPHHMTP